jgi:hypothetical protein
MVKVVMQGVAWGLYWLGHLASVGFRYIPIDPESQSRFKYRIGDILYRMYQYLMGKSADVQDKYELSEPWHYVDLKEK